MVPWPHFIIAVHLMRTWLPDSLGDEQEMDYDNENDVDHGAPEGPVYDHSEKSGEEIFSNETQHKDMPYGQDEDDDYESGPAPTMDESHEVSEESSSGHDLD